MSRRARRKRGSRGSIAYPSRRFFRRLTDSPPRPQLSGSTSSMTTTVVAGFFFRMSCRRLVTPRMSAAFCCLLTFSLTKRMLTYGTIPPRRGDDRHGAGDLAARSVGTPRPKGNPVVARGASPPAPGGAIIRARHEDRDPAGPGARGLRGHLLPVLPLCGLPVSHAGLAAAPRKFPPVRRLLGHRHARQLPGGP